jgi:hypothetical protein
MKAKQFIARIALVIVFLLALNGFSATSAFASGENWLSGWANRIKITIDHTKIDVNLTNFPVMVHLSTSSGIGSVDTSTVFDELNTSASRKKLAFTTSDGITQCYVEIAFWNNASEQAALWIKVPSISAIVDTILYLYYDHTRPDNTSYVGDVGSAPGETVWSDYDGVWHLDTACNGTTGEVKDSTANHNDGTGSGYPTLQTGELGLPVLYFDGVNDKISVPDADVLSVRPDTTTETICIISHMLSPHVLNQGRWEEELGLLYMGKTDGSTQQEWMFVYQSILRPPSYWTYSEMLQFYVSTFGAEYQAGSPYQTRKAVDGVPAEYIDVDDWVHVVGVSYSLDHTDNNYENSEDEPWENGFIIKDGNTKVNNGDASAAWGGYNIDYQNGSGAMVIGNYPNVGGSYWNGRISELRIRHIYNTDINDNALLLKAWAKAEGLSNKDELLSYEVLSATPPLVNTSVASGLTANGAALNANLTSMGSASSVTISFEYGLTNSYGSTIDGVPPILSSPGTFTASITTLNPNTLYHYRAKAVGDGTAYGSDQTFITESGDFSQWDVNSDGAINVLDIVLVGQRFNATGLPGWIREDVNRDGVINVLDEIVIGQHWS